MSRTIESPIQNPKDFYPMVGLRKHGQFVRGKVLEVGKTANDNPVVTLELIDLDGTTSKSVGKGKYEEVDVAVGDKVQLIGNLKDLKDKFPFLHKGDVATITYKSDLPTKRGKDMKIFEILVDD